MDDDNDVSAFKEGTLQYDSNTDVVIFTRKTGAEEFLVAVNVRNEPKTAELDASLRNVHWTNVLTGADFMTGNAITLSAFEHMILKKK